MAERKNRECACVDETRALLGETLGQFGRASSFASLLPGRGEGERRSLTLAYPRRERWTRNQATSAAERSPLHA